MESTPQLGEDSRIPKSKPPYPDEYRLTVIELARSGRTHQSLTKEFGVTSTTIRSWHRQTNLDEGRRKDGVTSDEKQELARLRKESERLREEHEIQERAAWLAQEAVSKRKEAFRVVRANRADHAMVTTCRVLKVSTSGSFAWLKRPASRRATSAKVLIARLKAAHEMSDGTYGAPSICAEMADADCLQVDIRHI